MSKHRNATRRVAARSVAGTPAVALRRAAAVAAAAAVAVTAAGQPAWGAITHRYSFSETLDATSTTSTVIVDSVGGASGNGVLVNRNAAGGTGAAPSFTGTSLVLNNGVAGANPVLGNYVDLPNNIVKTTDLTIETWSTWGGTTGTNGNWQRLFDIGTTTAGEKLPADTATGYTGSSYLFVSPQTGRNGNVYGSELKVGATNAVADHIGGGGVGANVERVQTLVIKGGTGGYMRLYKDGALVASVNHALDPAAIDQLNTWIGRSNFVADPFYNGSVNEFRTYNNAQLPGTTALNATIGADSLTATQNLFNVASGDFNNTANWSQNRVPIAGDVGVITGGFTATVSNAAANPIPAQIQIANGGLTVSGAGTTFTPAGGIDLAPASVGGAVANLRVDTGGVLITPGIFADADTTTAGTSAKNITLDAGTLQSSGIFTVGGTNLTVTLGAGGGTFNTAGGSVTLNAPIGGAGALTKTGANTLSLTQANTYAGATTVSGGTLNFASTSIPAGSAVTVAAATLQWATGNTADVTAGRTVTMGTGGATFDTNGNNVNLSGNIAGTTAFTKVGTGTLTLNGTLTPSNFHVRNGGVVINNTTVTTSAFSSVGQLGGDNGRLTVQGTGALTVNGDFNVADVSASTGSLIITTSGNVKATTFYVGKSGTDSGAVNQTAGTFSVTTGASDWRIGGNAAADTNAVGAVDVSGTGTFNAPGNFQIGYFGKGQMTVGTGGTLNVAGFPAVGRQVNSNGYLNVTGGTVNQTATGSFLLVGEVGTGTLNVTAGNVNLSTTNAAGLRIGNTAAATNVGYVNLAGGTVTARAVTTVAGSVSNLAFNGGTLRANATNATYMQGLTNAAVFPGGGTIDTNGVNITIAQNLLAPAGSGLATLPLATGGAGYVATPIVQITGGGGTGAAAVATVNASGVVTGITITNPGQNYTSAPTVTLVGGNAATAATLGTATIAATANTGGITKTGAGTLFLNGANTYGGATTVNAGTLGGSGTLAGPLVVNAATVAPGNSPGVLTSGSLTLAATSTALMELAGTTVGTGYDQLNVVGGVTLAGGNLGVAVGYAPTIGDTFVILNNDGAEPVVGTFATANGGPIVANSFTTGGTTFLINYAGATGGADGNDVTLTVTAVPEPATAGVLLAAGGLLLARRRRRVAQASSL